MRTRISKREQKSRADALMTDVMDELIAESHQEKLTQLVERAYDGGWPEYRKTIKECGNPADQIERFENAGIILQPKQLEFASWARRLDDAEHLDDELGAPELGFGGARGPGKSFGEFAQMALDDCQRMPGLKCLYLREIGRNAEEQLTELVQAVLANVEHEHIRGKVRFPNGSIIIVGHFGAEKDVRKYLGLQYDVILIEETTTLRLSAYRTLRASLRTSKVWRPRIYNSTNPLGIGHLWYKKRFIDHERKYAGVENRARKFIFATVDDNRFVNKDYVGNLDEYTGAELKAYRFGDWDVSAGAYFDEWSYDRHVVDEYWPTHQDRIWCSLDYGFNHWNVFYLHAMTPDGVIYTCAELAHRKHYPKEIWPDIRDLLDEFGIVKPPRALGGGDMFAKTGHSVESIGDQYEKLGIKFEAAITDPGSRVQGAHHMAKLLGNHERGIPPRWYVAKRCPKLVETMPMLERNPNNPEDVRKINADADGAGGDDAYDAARYGLYLEKAKGRLRVKSRKTI